MSCRAGVGRGIVAARRERTSASFLVGVAAVAAAARCRTEGEDRSGAEVLQRDAHLQFGMGLLDCRVGLGR